MTKQFKLGEHAIGGIIKVDITGQTIRIQALDYDTKKPVAFFGGVVLASDRNAHDKLDDLLKDMTTSYYSGMVLDWIKSKVALSREYEW